MSLWRVTCAMACAWVLAVGDEDSSRFDARKSFVSLWSTRTKRFLRIIYKRSVWDDQEKSSSATIPFPSLYAMQSTSKSRDRRSAISSRPRDGLSAIPHTSNGPHARTDDGNIPSHLRAESDMRRTAFETYELRWKLLLDALSKPTSAHGAPPAISFDRMPWPAFSAVLYHPRGERNGIEIDATRGLSVGFCHRALNSLADADLGSGFDLDANGASAVASPPTSSFFPLTRASILRFLEHPERKRVLKRLGICIPGGDLVSDRPTVLDLEFYRWKEIRCHVRRIANKRQRGEIEAAVDLVCTLLSKEPRDIVKMKRRNLQIQAWEATSFIP